MAPMPTSDDFGPLESEVEKNPTSEAARENLLEALSADPERFDDPRRFELIEWFIKHNPRHSVCTTPFMRVGPETAPDAYRRLKAEGTARELMQLVDEARARFGDKLDWPERSAEFWKRARNASADDKAASELVDAHSQHSYRKHWAQTVLGLLACRNDDVDRAVSHLRASADVRPEYRLSSYGPSLDLVREVCARGRWDEGLKYLRVWEDAWDHPRLREWIAAVEERRLPGSEEPE